jgi:hypothetical protein
LPANGTDIAYWFACGALLRASPNAECRMPNAEVTIQAFLRYRVFGIDALVFDQLPGTCSHVGWRSLNPDANPASHIADSPNNAEW